MLTNSPSLGVSHGGIHNCQEGTVGSEVEYRPIRNYKRGEKVRRNI